MYPLVRFVTVSMEEYASLLAEVDVPADFVWVLTYLFTEVRDGGNAHLTDGVRAALGRPPRDFSEYVRQVAASGVWADTDDLVA